MANNTQLNVGTGGDILVTDDQGSNVKLQVVKPGWGVAGTYALATLGYHAVAVASNNAENLKAAAAQLFRVHVFNNAGYPVYVKLYNKATAPVPGTDTPVVTVGVQAGTERDAPFSPMAFATGLGISMTKGIADNDNTVLVASDCVVDVEYL